MNCFDSFKHLVPLSPTIEKFIKKLMGERLIDIALHVPSRMEERFFYEKIKDIPDNTIATLFLEVASYDIRSSRTTGVHRIQLTDGRDRLDVTYFRARPEYLKKLYPIGQKILISGKVDHHPYNGKITMNHPDFAGAESQKKNWCGKKAIYPLTNGLNQGFVQRFIQTIIKNIIVPQEWIHESILSELALPSLFSSIQNIHNKAIDKSIIENQYKKRLCFDEFLSHQLALILSSRKAQIQKAIDLPSNLDVVLISPNLVDECMKALPFQLTNGQNEILKDIVNDFSKSYPMIRLLQGDVGSGKTIVAFMAALYQIAKGGQVAFLVPTEILAIQHFESLIKIFGDKVRIALLTGRHGIKQRRDLHKKLENGEVDLLIGTHALIEEGIKFKNLTFSIIDEQHRFGVEQRVALQEKGELVHLLSMTATPIPRTLTLAQYGDMDVSLLKEKPKGRKPIVTTILSLKKYENLLERLKIQVDQGEQVFWVCPLIENLKESPYTAAEKRFEALRNFFNRGDVLMIHGKMRPKEKDAIMEKFKNKDAKILVATTVIEVGVDVPNATIMVVENPERFGLAQLHQLRGRVGRGSKESYCILLYGNVISLSGRKRLEVMKNHDDGFELAEMDLKIRGHGETTGTQQSGMPSFKFCDFEKATPVEQDFYNNLLEKANAYAWDLLLKAEFNDLFFIAKKNLLPIYKKDNALTYAKSG